MNAPIATNPSTSQCGISNSHLTSGSRRLYSAWGVIWTLTG